jgi:hypothetical protein
MSSPGQMYPLQVYLDRRSRDQLEAWSKQRGWTNSDAVRAAIRALVASESPEEDSLLGASGMIRGLSPDASVAFDRYLAETFIAEKVTRTSQKSRTARVRSTKPRLRR